MKVRKLSGLLLMSSVLALSACGNASQSKSSQTTAQTENVPKEATALEVDLLLAQAATLINQEVSVEGVCTHICAHGGKKIFLMGSDDTQTIRVESGNLGAFKSECVNHIVTVKGVLKEDRIDEAYLQAWEAQLKESAEKHGEGEGCTTEKVARGETANTSDARIADFRERIAKREAEEGKAYLSFYHIEATDYEIQS